MASNVDGAVVIDVDMNVDDAEKELARLKKRVLKLEDEIGDKATHRSKISSDLVAARKELEKLKKEEPAVLVDGQFADNSEYYKLLGDAKEKVVQLEKELNEVDDAIGRQTVSLEWTKQRYGEILQLADDLGRAVNTDTISGRVKEAENELLRIEREGKGLGDAEYDAAYRKLALLTAEAKNYQKELAKTPEQIQKEEAIFAKAQEAERKRAEAERERVEAEQRLAYIKESAIVADQHIVDLTEELLALKTRLNELESAGVGAGYAEYDAASARISEINRELREYQNASLGVEEGTKKSASSMQKLKNRIKEIAASALVFNVISSGLRQFMAWTGKAVKTNNQARQSIAQLKGALLTLAQPLVEVIIPAFTMLVSVLTRVVAVVAQLVSALFGKTIKQSKDGAKALYKEANAIEGVGAAADEAAGSLAGFDEINTINTENTGEAAEAVLQPRRSLQTSPGLMGWALFWTGLKRSPIWWD